MASIEELDLKISEASSLYTRLKSSLAENKVAEMDVVISKFQENLQEMKVSGAPQDLAAPRPKTDIIIIIIIILSFDIAPFPYKHAQRRITFIVRG